MEGKKTPRRVATQARARATVDAIVRATDEIAHETGVESIVMANVAQRAGISLETLEQYFSHHDELLAAWEEKCFTRIAGEIGVRLVQIVQEPPEPEVAIAELVGFGFDAFLAHLRLFRHPDRAEFAARVATRGRVSDAVSERLGSVFASGKHAGRWRDHDRTISAHLMMVTVTWVTHDVFVSGKDEAGVAKVRGELQKLAVNYLLKDPA